AELADALDLGSSGQPWGFKSLRPHQTVEIRTLYQSVKGSDFYYILTIQILIANFKNTNFEISGDKTITGFISFLYIFIRTFVKTISF
ncbi:MAG: hypothetical protein U0M60_16420, partial [Clostridia bacterium]|nr:hypothetical protein [Clostridia bacterium]